MKRIMHILAGGSLLVVAGCAAPLPDTIEGCHEQYAAAENLDAAELAAAGTSAVDKVSSTVKRGWSFGYNLSRYESCLQQFDGDYPYYSDAGGYQVAGSSSTYGSLDLPSGYPLLPGDVELWFSMSLEQQQRALSFLEVGSTIQASLMED